MALRLPESVHYQWPCRMDVSTSVFPRAVRAYGEDRDLAFFLCEKSLAQKFFNSNVRAQKLGVTADVMARDSQASAGYWEIVRDALSDLVRIMLIRCYDEANHKQLYDHVRDLRGQVWL